VSYRAVLDASAMAAYAAGSEHVGEVLREIADEGATVALPVTALIEARVTVPDTATSLLDVLAGLPYTVVLPLAVDSWQQTAAAVQLLGGLGRACAALLVAHGHAGYVMTRDPGVYGEGIETIPIDE
jgi:hypothetical protein